MFVDKHELIAMFESELAAWEKLLAGLSQEQITDAWLPGGLSVKDTIAHLGTWLQRTIAQLDAGLRGHAPRYPKWPVDVDEDESDEAVDRANAWILESNRRRPWPDVHSEWREGFLRFLELVQAIPEADLLPEGKLAWMAEYEPLDGQPGSHEHHHAEHRVQLEAWIANRPET